MATKHLPLFDQVIGESEDIKNPKRESVPMQADTYKGIYAIHKYWSKKPHNLVADYIERFSKPSDLVIDSFCGSGITTIESVRLKRRAIGIDINPIATLITKVSVTPIDVTELKRAFKTLENELAGVINELYYTECPQCKNPKAIVTHTIWNNGSPIEVWYSCSQCKIEKGIKPASDNDMRMASNLSNKPTHWYPTNELIPNARINAKKGMRVCDLFTPRALVGLSLLLENIRKIEDINIRRSLELCFTASLPQASRMVFVIRRRGKNNGEQREPRTEVGSWVIGYWIPKEHFEINVWRCFENRFRRMLTGSEEINLVIPPLAKDCSSFEQLTQVQEGYWVSTGTATNLDISSDSIDYAFVDPPHGNRIPYLELSLMWNAWLGSDSDWQNEIIISEARSRNKDIDDYGEHLLVAFRELWRILKPNKYVSIAFNSLDDDTWFSLLNICVKAGFSVVEIKPLEYSARSVVQDNRNNALKTDFVITCQKHQPQESGRVIFDCDQNNLETKLSELFLSFPNGAETYEILNSLFTNSILEGKVYRISQIMATLEKKYFLKNHHWHQTKPNN
jgi:SAM-dependent methyltransferase